MPPFTPPTGSDVPGAICVSEDVGTFVLNGQDINFVARWGCLDLAPLHAVLQVVSGANRKLPGTQGRVALQHFGDELVAIVPIMISGVVDDMGAQVANDEVQWRQNIDDFKTLFTAPANAAPTIPATIFGATLGADVQVTGFDLVYKKRGLSKHSLTITVPLGEFS